MNETLKEIQSVRLDLSDYLFHFTKGEDAIKDLEKIVKSRKIEDINKNGVICFTEAPLHSLVDMFKIFDRYQKPLYAPYGIGVLKTKIFNLGGRSAIYGPEDEIKLFRKKVKWRYVNYSPVEDYTWLREWRLPTKVKNTYSYLEINPQDNFLVTRTRQEELDMAYNEGDIVLDGDMLDGQFIPHFEMIMTKNWKSISLERIAEGIVTSNKELKKWINDQVIGEEDSIYLGSG